MKISHFVRFFFLSTLLVFSLLPVQASAGNTATKLVIGYETVHNPPRALGSGTSINWDKPGLTLELLNLVAQQLNLEISYKRVPWKRGLYLLGKNEIDGIFHASFKAQREKIGVYPKVEGRLDETRAIFDQSYSLYKLESSPVAVEEGRVTQIPGGSEMGAISGYSIVGSLEKQNFSIAKTTTVEESLGNLASGRIAGFVNLTNMTDDYLRRNSHRFPNVVKYPVPVQRKPYFLLLSHKLVGEQSDLAERIWSAIRGVSASPEYSAILEKY